MIPTPLRFLSKDETHIPIVYFKITARKVVNIHAWLFSLGITHGLLGKVKITKLFLSSHFFHENVVPTKNKVGAKIYFLLRMVYLYVSIKYNF
jgi:hypothetical protein